MAGKTKTRRVQRSAETGKFVTSKYAKRHPRTTVTETVKVSTKKRRK